MGAVVQRGPFPCFWIAGAVAQKEKRKQSTGIRSTSHLAASTDLNDRPDRLGKESVDPASSN